MRRIAIFHEGQAGVKLAARIKRQDPRTEVVLVGERVGDPPKVKARGVQVTDAAPVELSPDGKTAYVEGEAAGQKARLPVPFDVAVLPVTAAPVVPPAFKEYAGVEPARPRLPARHKNAAPALVLGTSPEGYATVRALVEEGAPVTWLLPKGDAPLDNVLWWKAAALLAEQSVTVVELAEDATLTALLDEDDALIALKDGDTEYAAERFFFASRGPASGPFLADFGLRVHSSGLLLVNDVFQTENPRIFALGSGVATFHGQDDERAARLAECEELEAARVIADFLAQDKRSGEPKTGGERLWPGGLRPLVATLPGLSLARVGTSLAEAEALSQETELAVVAETSRETPFFLLLAAEKASGKVLGVQVLGGAEGESLAAALTDLGTLAIRRAMTAAELAGAVLPGEAGALLCQAAHTLVNKFENEARGIQGITPEELVLSKEQGADFYLMDLRPERVFAEGHLPGAECVPFVELAALMHHRLPRHVPLVLYAETSNEAYSAACVLSGVGATSLYVLDGGFALWPFELETGQPKAAEA